MPLAQRALNGRARGDGCDCVPIKALPARGSLLCVCLCGWVWEGATPFLSRALHVRLGEPQKVTSGVPLTSPPRTRQAAGRAGGALSGWGDVCWTGQGCGGRLPSRLTLGSWCGKGPKRGRPCYLPRPASNQTAPVGSGRRRAKAQIAPTLPRRLAGAKVGCSQLLGLTIWFQ